MHSPRIRVCTCLYVNGWVHALPCLTVCVCSVSHAINLGITLILVLSRDPSPRVPEQIPGSLPCRAAERPRTRFIPPNRSFPSPAAPFPAPAPPHLTAAALNVRGRRDRAIPACTATRLGDNCAQPCKWRGNVKAGN